MSAGMHRKLGWLGGWLGAILWVAIFAAIAFVNGDREQALVGFGLFATGLATIIATAPWYFPRVRMRLLMLPIYLVLLASIVWAVWVYGDAAFGIRLPLGAWVLLPGLLPLFMLGHRCWDDLGGVADGDD